MGKFPIYKVVITGYSHNVTVPLVWRIAQNHLQLHHDASLISPELHVFEDDLLIYVDTKFERLTPDQYSYRSSPIPDHLLAGIYACNLEMDLTLSYVHMLEVLGLAQDNCKTYVEYFNAYSTLLQMVRTSLYPAKIKDQITLWAQAVMNLCDCAQPLRVAHMWGNVLKQARKRYPDEAGMEIILAQIEYMQELSLLWNWR